MFQELDGVMENLPALIDEDLLFDGGEDFFEFLEEDSAESHGPPGNAAHAALAGQSATGVQAVAVVPRALDAPAFPPAPVVQSTSIPTGPTSSGVGKSKPVRYVQPLFLPFGKTNTIPSNLKLSGISSFKKIHSRLLHGDAMDENEEADVIREMEGALTVLKYQRQYLALHMKKLEEWASTVYSLDLAGHDSANEGRHTPPLQQNEIVPTTCDLTEGSDTPEEGSPFRKVLVSLKCKGANRRRIEGALVAHVSQSWQLPRSEGSSNNNKRKRQELMLAEPSKRSNLCQALSAKPDASGKRASDGSAAGLDDDETEPAFDACAHVPEAPGQIWTWLEDRNFFDPISKRQPLPEDLTIEANRCVDGGTLVPVQGSAGSSRKPVVDPGTRNGMSEDSADLLRQRLLAALVVPSACDIIRTVEDGDTVQTTKGSTKVENENGNGHVPMMLDVAKLNSEQRVVVQLGGVGLIGSKVNDFQQKWPRSDDGHELLSLQYDLSKKTKDLNHCKVALREAVSGAT